MLGLAILFIFAVYVVISIVATRCAVVWARRNGRLWGCITAFAMYNLVFWDMVPTLVMHKYYCSTQAGFWPYKSFDQWDAENPGISQGLRSSNKPGKGDLDAFPTRDDTERHWYNDRFYKEKAEQKIHGTIDRREEIFVDAENSTVISRVITFYRGLPPTTLELGGTPGEIRKSLVLGSGDRECIMDGQPLREKFLAFNYDFWRQGEGK